MPDRGRLPHEELSKTVASLMPFQQQSVDAVVEAMFERDQRRFLVADEVGLGKTKIAKAVMAETVRRLWDDRDTDRIDIIYMCSNSQIARQNLAELRSVMSGLPERNADRLTMLPTVLADLQDAPVNLVAFTPGTSLTFGHSTGQARERALLMHLLSQPEAIGPQIASRKGPQRLLSNGAQSFYRDLDDVRGLEIPSHVSVAYRALLEEEGLIDEFLRLSDGRRNPTAAERATLIRRLRRTLARACIDLLTPDLIILDEFQRFTSVLDGDGEDAELAKLLFGQEQARVLLLSATPYKMLSRADQDGENHAEGFSRTLRFLFGGPDAARKVDGIHADLAQLRRGIVGGAPLDQLSAARDRVQSSLREVVVRTERLAATPDRDGMLDTSVTTRCVVRPNDVLGFVGTDGVTQTLHDIPSIVEYWKSAPYLINFMDEYKMKRTIRSKWAERQPDLVQALRGRHMLSWGALNSYRKVDPQNPRARWLIDSLADEGAFDRLWLPPSWPQTELRGAYATEANPTKRLIFSGWAVAPKAVAGLVSYEFERRHHRDGARYASAHQRFSGRLTLPTLSGIGSSSERFSTLALLLPCGPLAQIGDPLRIARDLDMSLPLPLEDMRQHVRGQIEDLISPLLEAAVDDGRPSNIWYAAVLAHFEPEVLNLHSEWSHDTQPQGLADHIERLRDVIEDVPSWGAPPRDLVDRLVDLALGSPAILTQRGLLRVAGRFGETDPTELLWSAALIAWAFRSLFNSPEADALISAQRSEDYWIQVLTHCRDGALGSVLDEWFDLIPAQERGLDSSSTPLEDLAEAASRVLHLKDSLVSVEFFDRPTDDGPRVEHLRTHFAMRFGQARGETADGDNPVQVRAAFNSPFRPFVLMSTSVGQEGLDFHHYAHNIVHWNLPANPVDLEQREGRVHRFKNHAVRKNVAHDFGADARVRDSTDPWRTMFDLAEFGDGGMRPWWIYPGPTKIKREVPLLPMSADVGRLRDLVSATTLYRMTLGQPRQAELLETLAELPEDEREAFREATLVDLAPRTLRS